MKSKKRVLCAMSGGLDSSMAAYFLKKDGYDVKGITMDLGLKNDSIDKKHAGLPDVLNDAKKVCDFLDIEHYIVNYKDFLQEKVINKFVKDYTLGITPNPCISCNIHLKFGALLEQAKYLDCDYLATGHYADIVSYNNNLLLKRSSDLNKDQTYFLYGIAKESLKSILFPLAGMQKKVLRELAEEIKLPVVFRSESQDICFVPDKDIKSFLKGEVKDIIPGPIKDLNGKVLGEHKGIIFYTIGQRGGLGISHPKPLYVYSIDALSNTITVAENDMMFGDSLVAENLNLFVEDIPLENIFAKIRYAHQAAPCKVKLLDNQMHLTFDKKQRAITRGQAVVLYVDDMLIGGGIIK